MKIVLSIEISPKLLGAIDEEEFRDKLEKRCLSLVKSFKKKWDERPDVDDDEIIHDEIEDNWSEIIEEGFEDVKKSIEARVWK